MASLQKYEEDYMVPKQFNNSPLKKLICDIKENHYFLDIIKYPNIFISSLEELDNIIGNNEIKLNIVKQVKYLLSEMKEGNKNKNMLNTILYGPPGTGKTTIAKIMAKIWYSMGCIEKESFSIDKIFDNNFFLMFFAYAIYFLPLLSYLPNIYYKLKSFIKNISIILIFILLAIIYILYIYLFDYFMNNDKNVDNILKVVSREDFVECYHGWSDKKTISLLEKNKGKVLFIDEAYSLYNSNQDIFGFEVLTALNRYLSENPGKIFIIMAGYEDLMRKNIFTAQPGLERRFMWNFKCNGYDYNELYDILLYHVKNDGWDIHYEDKEKVKELIKKEYYIFKNYAGDIEKIIFYSKIDYAHNFGSNRVLEFYNIKYAIDYLKTNN